MNSLPLDFVYRKMDIASLPTKMLYVGAAGFEDRAFCFLSGASESHRVFDSCIALEYRPYNNSNRKSEFNETASVAFSNLEWGIYDRFDPEAFAKTLDHICALSRSFSRLVVDISAMSKMLVVVLLQGLRDLSIPLSVIYAPARVYHPLKADYEKRRLDFPDAYPDFLTTDVYTVVTTRKLSSIAMQGAPLAMTAYPNFNHLELLALVNEMSPNHLVLIEGVPFENENAWKLEAIREINRDVQKSLAPIRYTVDPLDLASNVEILERIYTNVRDTHKIVLAPTGGKLQALATFFLKNMHPDIHVVCPVVSGFAREYTEGWRDPIQIDFSNFREWVGSLDRHRTRSLAQMEEIIRKLGQSSDAR